MYRCQTILGHLGNRTSCRQVQRSTTSNDHRYTFNLLTYEHRAGISWYGEGTLSLDQSRAYIPRSVLPRLPSAPIELPRVPCPLLTNQNYPEPRLHLPTLATSLLSWTSSVLHVSSTLLARAHIPSEHHGHSFSSTITSSRSWTYLRHGFSQEKA